MEGNEGVTLDFLSPNIYIKFLQVSVSLKWNVLEILGAMKELSSKRENCSGGVDKFRFLGPWE